MPCAGGGGERRVYLLPAIGLDSKPDPRSRVRKDGSMLATLAWPGFSRHTGVRPLC